MQRAICRKAAIGVPKGHAHPSGQNVSSMRNVATVIAFVADRSMGQRSQGTQRTQYPFFIQRYDNAQIAHLGTATANNTSPARRQPIKLLPHLLHLRRFYEGWQHRVICWAAQLMQVPSHPLVKRIVKHTPRRRVFVHPEVLVPGPVGHFVRCHVLYHLQHQHIPLSRLESAAPLIP